MKAPGGCLFELCVEFRNTFDLYILNKAEQTHSVKKQL
jgi:hypothetical protein